LCDPIARQKLDTAIEEKNEKSAERVLHVRPIRARYDKKQYYKKLFKDPF
jgi:hypothetical protein